MWLGVDDPLILSLYFFVYVVLRYEAKWERDIIDGIA